MKFTKMQGAGNDYVYVNCFEEKVDRPERAAVLVSDRHFGIGADGLVLICPSSKADVRMRMFNADGSEGAMCGNAIRCVGKYVYDRGMVRRERVTVETLGGIKELELQVHKGTVDEVTVDMGIPKVISSRVPEPINIEGTRSLWGSLWAIPMRCISGRRSTAWTWSGWGRIMRITAGFLTGLTQSLSR